MSKRLRQGPDDLETQLLPQLHCRCIRTDDEVELHGFVAGLPRLFETVLAHGPAGARALRRGIDHERRIGHVLAKAAVIWGLLVYAADETDCGCVDTGS